MQKNKDNRLTITKHQFFNPVTTAE